MIRMDIKTKHGLELLAESVRLKTEANKLVNLALSKEEEAKELLDSFIRNGLGCDENSFFYPYQGSKHEAAANKRYYLKEFLFIIETDYLNEDVHVRLDGGISNIKKNGEPFAVVTYGNYFMDRFANVSKKLNIYISEILK